jgi:hypothetical protein
MMMKKAAVAVASRTAARFVARQVRCASNEINYQVNYRDKTKAYFTPGDSPVRFVCLFLKFSDILNNKTFSVIQLRLVVRVCVCPQYITLHLLCSSTSVSSCIVFAR